MCCLVAVSESSGSEGRECFCTRVTRQVVSSVLSLICPDSLSVRTAEGSSGSTLAGHDQEEDVEAGEEGVPLVLYRDSRSSVEPKLTTQHPAASLQERLRELLPGAKGASYGRVSTVGPGD